MARVTQRLSRVAGMATGPCALAITVAGGSARPQYSQRAHFISELGERGSPNSRPVNLGFAGVCALTTMFVVGTTRECHRSAPELEAPLWSMGGVAVGYGVAALAPCDPGCPAVPGSVRQGVHNAGGIMQYCGAILSMGTISRRLTQRGGNATAAARTSRLLTVVAVAGAGAASVPQLAPWRGWSQRVAEAAIFTWIAAVGTRLATLTDQGRNVDRPVCPPPSGHVASVTGQLPS